MIRQQYSESMKATQDYYTLQIKQLEEQYEETFTAISHHLQILEHKIKAMEKAQSKLKGS
jgi:hypothetical protein